LKKKKVDHRGQKKDKKRKAAEQGESSSSRWGVKGRRGAGKKVQRTWEKKKTRKGGGQVKEEKDQPRSLGGNTSGGRGLHQKTAKCIEAEEKKEE